MWRSYFFLLVACLFIGGDDPVKKGSEPLRKPKQPPILSGRIQQLEGNRMIVVDAKQGSAEVKGYVTITNETVILQKVGGKLVTANYDDLKKGMNVSVWQEGPIMMIYPYQLTADQLILE